MHRIYYPKKFISGDSIAIATSQEVHYLKDVLRLRVNDRVIIFDGEGTEYACEIEKIAPRKIDLKTRERRYVKKREPEITVACSIPKKSKMDDIVDRLTQLGVSEIIPLLTERVNIEWSQQQCQKHIERWRRIAVSACEQSGRAYLPFISEVKDIKTVLSRAPDFDLKLIPTLVNTIGPIRQVLGQPRPRAVLILIGPEGDFTPEEIRAAEEKGFIAVSLGELVLRVETAAVAVAGYLRLVYEDS